MSRRARPAGGSRTGPRSGVGRVAGHQHGRDREHEVVDAVRGDQLAQQPRAALAQDRARAALGAQVLEDRRHRELAGLEALHGDPRALAGDLPVGLGVDLHARGRLGQQRDVAGQVQPARDRGDDRLGLEPGRGAVRALVVVEQVGVALGAQGARADEDRVDRGAQLAQQRAVGGVAEPDRAPLDGDAAVGRGDHRRHHARAPERVGRHLAQAQRAHDLARRPPGARVGQGPQPGVGHARIMPRRPAMVPAQCRPDRREPCGAGGHDGRPLRQPPSWSRSPAGWPPWSWSLSGALQRWWSLAAGCAVGIEGAGACDAVVAVGGAAAAGTCAVVAGASLSRRSSWRETRRRARRR